MEGAKYKLYLFLHCICRSYILIVSIIGINRINRIYAGKLLDHLQHRSDKQRTTEISGSQELLHGKVIRFHGFRLLLVLGIHLFHVRIDVCPFPIETKCCKKPSQTEGHVSTKDNGGDILSIRILEGTKIFTFCCFVSIAANKKKKPRSFWNTWQKHKRNYGWYNLQQNQIRPKIFGS